MNVNEHQSELSNKFIVPWSFSVTDVLNLFNFPQNNLIYFQQYGLDYRN